MIRARIIAYRSKLACLRARTEQRTCACRALTISYLPERRVGDVRHGALVCVRYEKGAKP